MSENPSQLAEADSKTQSVFISEDYPIIEATTESSFLNRLGKFAHQVGQHEWISEMDLFSTPMKLNVNGNYTYKTQFGGIMYLLVGFICVFITALNQFPNGFILKDPITFYSIIEDSGSTQTVFDYSDTFFQFYIYNVQEKREANSEEYAFMMRKISVLQVNQGVATALELSTNCTVGVVCFKQSSLNSKAYIFGSSATNQATLNLQYAGCEFFDFDPVLGMCVVIMENYIGVLEITTFREVTGNIQSTSVQIELYPYVGQQVSVDTNQYTTNNDIFGYIANIFSYQFNFYDPIPLALVSNITQYDQSLDCFSYMTFSGNICTWIQFQSSGTTNVYTQNFDNITTPILFLLSISQTLFYIIYRLIVKNYSNNALFLRIADSVAYIQDNYGSHYNFKSGPFVFLACLIHNNIITKGIDYILYRMFETHLARLLPLKAHFTIKMIDYGQQCLGEEMFFNRINRVYEQQNLQPTKIIFEEKDEKQQKQLQKSKVDGQSQNEQDIQYFDNEIDQEAFRRMCKDHELYQLERKKHLSSTLKRSDKNYKLVLYAQSLFENYRTQVKSEYNAKQVELPIGFNFEEQSAIEIRKQRL